MNERAYSTLTLKTINEEKRILTGVASTPSTDRMGDIVEPKGAQFKLPLAFLWQHDASQPVGHVTKAKVTSNGIEVEVQLVKIDEPGTLKNRLDEAWQSIKAGLVRGMSIGFSPVEAVPIKDSYGMRFLKWDWLELSAVTIPANAEASIHAIKSLDTAQLAATGRQRSGLPPGASGTKQQPAESGFSFSQRQRGNMKTLQEMREERENKTARLKELIDQKNADNRAFSDDEGTEVDALTDEVKALDDEIRVARFHATNAAAAKSVDGSSRSSASGSRGPTIVIRSSDVEEKFKGQNFTRGVIAKALAGILGVSPSRVAEQRWGKSNPTLARLIKANEVPGGGTGSGEWGHELVQADTRYTGDFIEYLYAQTVFDQLGLREIPANVAIKGQDGAATGYWVGESKAIPATTGDFSSVSLTPLKVAALAVISNELLADSSPAAEQLVRDALVEASAQRIDTTFLSATAASAGVSPAGILNGVSGTASSGTDADGVRTDLKVLLGSFITAKNRAGLTLVTTPSLAASLGLMFNALGTADFPGMNVNGGTLQGYKVVVGDNVPSGDLIMLNPREIYKIGDSGVQISVSRDATIEQSTVPAGATDTPVAMTQAITSMFQEESTAIKVVRRINFAKRRTSAVALITAADYGVAES